ncbi:MAG: hypothetical protein U1F87_13690 [Kiritimatiellia bacterium]
MKTKVGIWIDHREAVVATITWRGETMQVIPCHAERHPSRADDTNGRVGHDLFKGPQDDARDRAYMEHLKHFYDEVIRVIHGADTVVLMRRTGRSKSGVPPPHGGETHGQPDQAFETAGKNDRPPDSRQGPGKGRLSHRGAAGREGGRHGDADRRGVFRVHPLRHGQSLGAFPVDRGEEHARRGYAPAGEGWLPSG